jgi:heptosyltransferase II
MNILLVQTSFIGDTILSTPVVSGLKNQFPKAKLTIMTTPVSAELFQHDPLIDRIIMFDKRGREKGLAGLLEKAIEIRRLEFDVVYSLHRSFRTSLILFMANIPIRTGFSDSKLAFLYTKKIQRASAKFHAVVRNFSILPEHPLPIPELRLISPSVRELSSVTRNILSKHYGPVAILAPGSTWKTKQWHEQGFIEIARFLIQKGMLVILIGNRADQFVCRFIEEVIKCQSRVVNLAGKIPLSDTMYLVENADLMICNDSMALHMASAYKIPTVVIFCATSPSFGFGPWRNPKAIIVEDGSLDCKPCRRHGSMSCPKNTGKCMTVSSQKVMDAVDRLLRG